MFTLESECIVFYVNTCNWISRIQDLWTQDFRRRDRKDLVICTSWEQVEPGLYVNLRVDMYLQYDMDKYLFIGSCFR